MKIEVNLPVGLSERAYRSAAGAARKAAVLRLFEEHAISCGRAAQELGMDLEDFMTWASAQGVAILQLDDEDLSSEVQSALEVAGSDP